MHAGSREVIKLTWVLSGWEKFNTKIWGPVDIRVVIQLYDVTPWNDRALAHEQRNGRQRGFGLDGFIPVVNQKQ